MERSFCWWRRGAAWKKGNLQLCTFILVPVSTGVVVSWLWRLPSMCVCVHIAYVCVMSVLLHSYAPPIFFYSVRKWCDRSCPRRRWSELWSAENEQRNTAREFWLNIIHLDIGGGGDEDHDGYDESSVIRVSSLGWVHPPPCCTCLRSAQKQSDHLSHGGAFTYHLQQVALSI